MDIAPLKLQIRRPKRDAVSYPLATIGEVNHHLV